MRIAILWQQMSGYFDACLRALDKQGHEVYLLDLATSPEAPFGDGLAGWVPHRRSWTGNLGVDVTLRELRSFGPDALLVSSWHIPEYRKLARAFAGQVPRVLCMDNWWVGSPKQWLGRLGSRLYLQPFFDLAFVPGIRQAQFAAMLGFDQGRIFTGLYSADTEGFASLERPASPFAGRSFLYAGRLVEEKGFSDLLIAYDCYRSKVDQPWPLRVAGVGPLAAGLAARPGIEHLGFCQPNTLPTVMGQSAVFLLPSRHEHWGVVVHEAAAAGLALCCTVGVPAADRFLQDGFNGLLVPARDPRALGLALQTLGGLSDAALAAMAEGSRSLARQLSPDLWVRNLTFHVRQA